ncbi:hypothetical protein G4D82_13390 [Flavobacterium sp. CYK-4]|uniref:hypothetical protein n=1 Tax=Flavobacterium lotistagni TaxID=2709660 RepID=UPI00140CA126|nr:hypothetical protein [Flavobacterium lotistagni]NHM08218.1 hypothetical protein [Flavobacterium lotistagni]
MKVLNIHKRRVNQPKAQIVELFRTLASENDLMLATHKWSPMKLDQGLQVGSKGGHGPIKYHVVAFHPEERIVFQFDLKGFDGTHEFSIAALDQNSTELSHVIDMKTSGFSTLKWIFAIRWLHDAFIEDAFDKVENYFSASKKRSEWSFWVKLLRRIMKPKKK